MNNVRKLENYSKKNLKSNFEKRHKELADFHVTVKDGPFMKYATMIASTTASKNKNEVTDPCRRFFNSTQFRRFVGDKLMENYMKAISLGSNCVGSVFSDFTKIATPKTIREILNDAHDADYIYIDEQARKKEVRANPNSKYIYWPTPIFIKSWCEAIEEKLNFLHQVNITDIMAEINSKPKILEVDYLENTICDNSLKHQTWKKIIKKEINKMSDNIR